MILSLAHVPVYLDGPEKVVANLMETGGAMFSKQMFRPLSNVSAVVPNANLARLLSGTKSVVNEVSDQPLTTSTKTVPTNYVTLR